MNELASRIVTGIIFIVVMVGGVIWHPLSFLLLFAVITGLCIREFHNIIDLKLSGERSWKRASKYINILIGLLVLGLIFMEESGRIPVQALLIITLMPCVWFIIEMYGKSSKPFVNLAFNATAIIYLAIPFSTACFIVFNDHVFQPQYLLAILFFAWANDSLAYVFGRLFGKTQLSPKYSPKKSVEGTVGGVVSAIGFGYLAYILIPLALPDSVPTPLTLYLILAGITAVMSNYGDLAESMIKRNLNVKDSGTMLPGHGGFLDRFDGLIFALPACAVFLELYELGLLPG